MDFISWQLARSCLHVLVCPWLQEERSVQLSEEEVEAQVKKMIGEAMQRGQACQLQCRWHSMHIAHLWTKDGTHRPFCKSIASVMSP